MNGESFQFFMFVKMCQYGVCRALFCRLVGEDDIGKMYSFIGIVSAIVPIASTPTFRQEFNRSFETLRQT